MLKHHPNKRKTDSPADLKESGMDETNQKSATNALNDEISINSPHQLNATSSGGTGDVTSKMDEAAVAGQVPKDQFVIGSLDLFGSARWHSKYDLKCENCELEFYCSQELTLHRREVHLNLPVFICHFCGRKFSYRSSRSHHITREHSALMPIRCKICKVIMVDVTQLKEHVMAKHANSNGHAVVKRLKGGGIKLKQKVETEQKNIGSKSPPIYSNDQTQRGSQDQVKAEPHVEERESTGLDQPDQEKRCQLNAGRVEPTLTSEDSMDQEENGLEEMEFIGPDPKEMNSLDQGVQIENGEAGQDEKDPLEVTQHGDKCQDCGQLFYSSVELNDHINKVHLEVRVYQCNYCIQTFSNKKSRSQHVQRRHSEVKKVSCKICNLIFRDASRLIDHVFEKHNNDELEDKMDWLKSDICELPSQTLFTCELCNRQFSCREYIKNHVQNVHMALRSFSCTFCESKFKRKEHLQRHLRRVHAKMTNIIEENLPTME